MADYLFTFAISKHCRENGAFFAGDINVSDYGLVIPISKKRSFAKNVEREIR